MATAPPPDDDVDPQVEQQRAEMERGLEDEGFRTVDGAGSDEPLDPAMIPVIEGGGGVAEGFEQSEAELVDNAEQGPLDGTERILEDAGEAEAEEPRGTYGQPDQERISEGGDSDR